MAQYYVWESRELLDLIKGKSEDEAVEIVGRYIDAKVEGAIEASMDYFQKWE